MSEMEWENAPEVSVPRVREWLGPALKDWREGCYPPRRGVTVVWGCLFVVPWAFWQALKFFIYAAGIVLMLFANVVWIVAELVTYRHRLTREQRVVWTRYILELHEKDA